MSKSAKGTAEQPGRHVRAKSGLNRSILAQGWYEMRRQLEYKQRWRGGQVLAVPPAYTSQIEARITITRAVKSKRIDEETGTRLKVQSGSLFRVRLIVIRMMDEELTRLAASVLDQFGDV